MFLISQSLQKYIFGQVLSMILAATGLINGWFVEKKKLNIPAVQAAFTYTLILIGSLFYLLAESRFNSTKRAEIRFSAFYFLKKHKNILLGSILFDVAANWLVVKAFSELKLPEVMVLSGLSTPVSIIIAFIWKYPTPKYSLIQLTGVTLALGATVFYFSMTGREEGFTNSITGVFFAVSSAVAYAASNFFQEKVALVLRPIEFLLGLGLLGSFISWIFVIGSCHEVEMVLKSLDFQISFLILLYALILSTFYFLIPVYMCRYSAVSFNFSLLTANFLGIFGSWFLLRAEYSKWLYVSIVFINSGLLIFFIGEEMGTRLIEEKTKTDTDTVKNSFNLTPV